MADRRGYGRGFRDGIRPEPDLSVSEWADQNRMLSTRASAEPGPWRTSRTPYLRAVMDELSPSCPTQEVVFIAGSQVGKTESGLNWIGFVMDGAPSPMLVVQPTVDIAKRFSKQRLSTLIEDCPALREKVAAPRERDSGNTLLAKEAPGMILLLAGANSAAGLKSMPIRNLFGDEIDTWPGDVEGEGDPVELALARSRTFARRKALWTSTPTEANRSRIWAKWEESSQGRYHLPCPHCGTYQPITWAQIRYDPADLSVPPVLICVDCETPIEERQKGEWYANDLGRWVHEFPDRPVRGFHVSSLYSPLGWFSWADAVRRYEKAKESPEQMKVFTNTILGETFTETGDVPDWEELYRRREAYPRGIVPRGALVLTAAADIQRDRIEVEVIAWGPNLENWSVDYLVLPGDTSTIQTDPKVECVWRNLGRELSRVFPCEAGGELKIARAAIDSGDQTQTVYAWVRSQHDPRIVAIKGRPGAGMTTAVGIPKPQEVSYQGKKIRGGIRLWPIGVDLVKTEVYGWLRQPPPLNPGDPVPRGFSHFPQYGETYFMGLTAEELRRKVVKGFTRYEWEKVRDRNEPLDLRVYNRAAAYMLGIERWSPAEWERRRELLGQAKPEGPAVEEQQAPPAAAAPVEQQAPPAATPAAAPPPPRRRRVFGMKG